MTPGEPEPVPTNPHPGRPPRRPAAAPHKELGLPARTADHPAWPAFKAWADERLGPAFLWAAYWDCWLAAQAAHRRTLDPPREWGPEPTNEETE